MAEILCNCRLLGEVFAYSSLQLSEVPRVCRRNLSLPCFNIVLYFHSHIKFNKWLIHKCQSHDNFGVGCVCGLTGVQSLNVLQGFGFFFFACTNVAADIFIIL